MPLHFSDFQSSITQLLKPDDFHVQVHCRLFFRFFLVAERINAKMNSISSSNSNGHGEGSKHSALTPPLTIHFIALKKSYHDVQAVTFQALVQCASQRLKGYIFTLYWILSLSLDRAKRFVGSRGCSALEVRMGYLSPERPNVVISKDIGRDAHE
jgi:hypothetical protein